MVRRDGEKMLDQRRLDEVVGTVARITGRNVTLDDVYSRVLAYDTSIPTTDRARLESVLMKSVTLDARTWEEAWKLSTRQQPFILPANPDMGLLARICIPLIYRGLRMGYLWILVRDDDDAPEPILELVKALGIQLDSFAYDVMEAIEPQTQDGARHERQLIALLNGTSTEAGIQSDASPPEWPLRVLVMSTPSLRSASHLGLTERKRLVRQAMADALRIVRTQPPWAPAADHVAALIPAKISEPDLATIQKRFSESLALHGLTQKKGISSTTAECGISREATNAVALHHKYAEAIATLQACHIDSHLASLSLYESIGIYQFLCQAGPSAMAESEKIKAILHDANGRELLSTLEMVYDFNGPRSDLAKELHLHRTSLYHRIHRIEQIIGADPMESYVRLELHVALKARRWSSRPQFETLENYRG